MIPDIDFLNIVRRINQFNLKAEYYSSQNPFIVDLKKIKLLKEQRVRLIIIILKEYPNTNVDDILNKV